MTHFERVNDHHPGDDETLKNLTHHGNVEVERRQERVYALALETLNQAEIPYAVGAAFARHHYTGIWRKTKVLDVFVLPQNLKKALAALDRAGFQTSIENHHWLAKAKIEPHFIDLIFGTGSGQVQIDRRFFERSVPAEVLGMPTNLVPVEEMLATSMFVATRSRFDGAEVVHLIHSQQGRIDWVRLLELLGENREILLWHLIFFDIVYPGHADFLPRELMVQLFDEVRQRWREGRTPEKAFRGMFFDPYSFSVDVEDWGYEDARDLEPLVVGWREET